jgi:hypothetical protein
MLFTAHHPAQFYHINDFGSRAKFGVRYCPKSMIFDTAAPMMFPTESEYLFYILAVMCSRVAFEILKMINPTIAFRVGDVLCYQYYM